MQCADARSLLEQGLSPGTADAVRTSLGFHLARCEACRAVRVRLEQQRLLQTLLSAPSFVAVGPSLAQRPVAAARPAARPRRRLSAALLVAGSLAVVPIIASPPQAATAHVGQNMPQGIVSAPRPVAAPAVVGAAGAAAMPKGTLHRVAPKPHILAPRPVNEFRAEPRVERSQQAPATKAEATTDWAVFAPADAAAVARSQLIAFEQAGPQQLPAQLVQLAADDMFASVPLQAGQVLFLPQDPPLPPEPPPPAVFVPADTLPALPAPPLAPAPRPPQTKPAPKPATKPRTTVQQSARTYTVRSGDTLTAIALQVYGDATRWRSIYEANRSTIGSNPNLIRPSQKLVVPALPQKGGTNKPPATSQRIYTVRSGDTLSAIALEFYGDGTLWPLIYAANRATIGGNPDLIFPQQRLAVPSRNQGTPSGGSTKPVAKPAPVKATGKLTYTVAKGDSLRGLAKRVYGDESRWPEIYRANRSLIPDADRLQIGITLTIP